MQARSVKEILESIDNHEFLLPDFQRGYVWKSSQIEKYFQSLYKRYPTGSLIMWSAPKEYLQGNFERTRDASLILDGQQRVTTLYMAFTGKRPTWVDSDKDVPSVYFDLENEAFKVIKKIDKVKHLLFVSIKDILRYDVDDIVHYSHDPTAMSRYTDRIIRLRELLSYTYNISIVIEPDVGEIVEMFNALNSEGTRLSETDLALAIMVITWPDTKKEIARLVSKYKYMKFDFGKDFIIRLLNIICCDKAKYSDLKTLSGGRIESGIRAAEKALDYIVMVWNDSAHIFDSNLFSSLHPFLIISYYLTKNKFVFDNEQSRDRAIYFSFVAMLWGRYSGATEATLDKDVRFVRDKNSLELIIQEIAHHRGNQIYVTTDDIKGKGLNTTIFKLYSIAVLSLRPRDWVDPSLPIISVNTGKSYSIEHHHIFPKNLLKRIVPTSIGSDYKTIANQIANIGFLTSINNKGLSDAGPSMYLSKVAKTELEKQCVPLNEKLWASDYQSYSDFIAERLVLMRDRINSFLKSFYPNFKTSSPEESREWYDKINDFECKIRKIIANACASCKVNTIDFFGQSVYEKVEARIESHKRTNPMSLDSTADVLAFVNYLEMGDYNYIITSESNWAKFSKIFLDPKTFKNRFYSVRTLRNQLHHNRELDLITIKDCEASLMWFNEIFIKYDNAKAQVIKKTETDKENEESYLSFLSAAENCVKEFSNELCGLDKRIWVEMSTTQQNEAQNGKSNCVLNFAPSEWGMSQKNVPPFVFALYLKNDTEKKFHGLELTIEFTDTFKKSRRDDFLSDLKKAKGYNDFSFYNFELSINTKFKWVARKFYSLDSCVQKLVDDYIELSDVASSIASMLRIYSSRDAFSSPVGFF